MYEQTYDIIEWKSCRSCSSQTKGTPRKNENNTNNSNSRNKDKNNKTRKTKKDWTDALAWIKSENVWKNDFARRKGRRLGSDNFTNHERDVTMTKNSDGSNESEILFPSLFYDEQNGIGSGDASSVTTLLENDVSDCWASQTINEIVPSDMEVVGVYQKVQNWVSAQKMFFKRYEEGSSRAVLEDDDIEVIDPVDLFHESLLDQYLLVTEDAADRRAILRSLSMRPPDMGSVEELTHTNSYKFIRTPQHNSKLQMDRIIEFGDPQVTDDEDNGGPLPPLRKFSACSNHFPNADEVENNIPFLGVPRIIENYVVLNREGGVVNTDTMTDLWLSPFEDKSEENVGDDDQINSISNQSELDFLSSWFSDVYHTDGSDSEKRHGCATSMTELEKLTVISVISDEEEVWVDAPEIPHWLDEGTDDHGLFNQPSRPLYYYRDRIKGCYRIIGVEDETVVLFSGNDDDTIFYNEDNKLTAIAENTKSSELDVGARGKCSDSYDLNAPLSLYSKYRQIYNRLLYGRNIKEEQLKGGFDSNDTKNDSGIDEDIDETTCEEHLVPFSVPSEETNGYESVVGTFSVQRSTFVVDPHKESFVECFFVVMGACIVVVTLVLYENSSPMFNSYRSKITEDAYDNLYALLMKHLW